MRSYKILIIDDSEFILRASRALLEKEGFNVVTTARAVGSVGLILKEKPDLVLLDVTMPTMRGDSVARLITATKSQTCVVLYSGLDEARLQLLTKESGAHGYIRKSGSQHRILLQVRDFLTRLEPLELELVPAPPSIRLPTRKILLVDHELTRLSQARNVVQTLGHTPLFALSLEQALEKLEMLRPDLVLVSDDMRGAQRLHQTALQLDPSYARRFHTLSENTDSDQGPRSGVRLTHPLSLDALGRMLEQVS